MNEFIKIDVAYVTAQINSLKITYPELADDDELLADMLEGETDFHKVMSKLVRLRQERRASADGLSDYIGNLAERKARTLRGADAFTSLMKGIMDAAGQEKLVLPEATISVTKARESVTVIDAEQLPQGYFATIRQPDKKAIGDAIKAGESIPGAVLALGEPTLTIRTK